MMSESLNQSAPGAPGTPVAHRTGRLFFAVWGQAWLLTILGGGGCGLVCAGFVSMVFFFWTIPGGMYLGFFLGIPLGLVIAVLVTRRATPPGDPARLTRQLELVGITIAMLITASINLYLWVRRSSLTPILTIARCSRPPPRSTACSRSPRAPSSAAKVAMRWRLAI